jgi:hypothetical protein
MLPPDALVYAFSHGQFMQALRIALLYPQWTAEQRMAHFWDFDSRHPILNTAQLEACYHEGAWHLANPTFHPSHCAAAAQLE